MTKFRQYLRTSFIRIVVLVLGTFLLTGCKAAMEDNSSTPSVQEGVATFESKDAYQSFMVSGEALEFSENTGNQSFKAYVNREDFAAKSNALDADNPLYQVLNSEGMVSIGTKIYKVDIENGRVGVIDSANAAALNALKQNNLNSLYISWYSVDDDVLDFVENNQPGSYVKPNPENTPSSSSMVTIQRVVLPEVPCLSNSPGSPDQIMEYPSEDCGGGGGGGGSTGGGGSSGGGSSDYSFPSSPTQRGVGYVGETSKINKYNIKWRDELYPTYTFEIQHKYFRAGIYFRLFSKIVRTDPLIVSENAKPKIGFKYYYKYAYKTGLPWNRKTNWKEKEATSTYKKERKTSVTHYSSTRRLVSIYLNTGFFYQDFKNGSFKNYYAVLYPIVK